MRVKLSKGIVLATFLALFGCRPKVALLDGYDFGKIQRVGVIKFDSSRVSFGSGYDPGNAVADEFVFQFINRGVRVIERSRIEQILQEQSLWKSGNLDPKTVKGLGKLLGVDALIMGSVTKYHPDRKERIYIRDIRGQVREEIFLVEAEVGISARMVDTETGEIIWAGNYSYDSFYIDSAIRQAVSAILNSLKGSWFS
ncbi:MAG: hypothetical protein GX817_05875 [Elusimicrobia bacterium]|nr:hypothetical protein [Elusimicrobiota bacterium]